MKLLLAATILLSFPSFSQEKKADVPDFEKYSYLVMHMSGNTPVGNSTGFFIRSGPTLFFITTYHTCTCVDMAKKQIMKPEWDKVYIRLYNKQGNTIFYPVNLAYLQRNRTVELFVDHPDLCLYKIDDIPDSIKVNSIDEVVSLNKYAEKVPDRALMYGFPRTASDTSDVHYLASTKTEGKLMSLLEEPTDVPELNTTDMNIMAIHPSTLTGAAGSPVFFQYLDKSHNVKNTVFAGMAFGGNNSENSTYVLRAKYILEIVALAK